MKTPVVILTRNCIELTKRCIASVRNQDVETTICVYDNGSTDGTVEWLLQDNRDIAVYPFQENRGVTCGWNTMLSGLFRDGHSAVLVLNNDTVLPSWFLRELASYVLMYNLDAFVTGVATDDMSLLDAPAGVCPPSPHPDFSAFLIGRDVWEKVGPFDERFVLYCQDCAFHVEAHRKGVKLWKVNVPYFHINSQTLRRSTPEEKSKINWQANRDRQVFKEKYGCLPGAPTYSELFK